MTDQQLDTSPPGGSPDGPRRRRGVVLAAVLVGLLLIVVGGVVAYRLAGSPEDDPGVTACRSADVVVRADGGEQVAPAELTRVGELFQRSAHDDLKSDGVLAVGLIQRAQDPRGAAAPGADLYRNRLRAAVLELVAACERHGVTVEG